MTDTTNHPTGAIPRPDLTGLASANPVLSGLVLTGHVLAGLALTIGLDLAGLAPAAQAHEPIARCVLIDPRTVRCKAGYGHGEGAPDATMDVLAHDGRTLVAGKLDRESTLTFPRPAERFYVLFDVGPGHQAIVEDDEIGPAPAGGRAAWMLSAGATAQR